MFTVTQKLLIPILKLKKSTAKSPLPFFFLLPNFLMKWFPYISYLSTKHPLLCSKSWPSTVCVKYEVKPMNWPTKSMSSLQILYVTTFFLHSFSLPTFHNCQRRYRPRLFLYSTAILRFVAIHMQLLQLKTCLFNTRTPPCISVLSFHRESSDNLQPALLQP